MSTRSQMRRNNFQENAKRVNETVVCPIPVENRDLGEPGVVVAGPSRAKSPRIENSAFESLRASLKEEITSAIKSLLSESQKALLILLKPKTGENVCEENEVHLEDEPRRFYTPTKTVRIRNVQNNNPNQSRTKS